MVGAPSSALRSRGVRARSPRVGNDRRSARRERAPTLRPDHSYPYVRVEPASRAEQARRLKARRVELVLAFPAFVAEAGSGSKAAKALGCTERDVRRWLKAARTLSAFGFDWMPSGNIATLRSRTYVPMRSRFVMEAVAAWLDQRRAERGAA